MELPFHSPFSDATMV